MKTLRYSLIISAAMLPLAAFAQTMGSTPEQVRAHPVILDPATSKPVMVAPVTAPESTMPMEETAVAVAPPEVPPQVASLQEEWALVKYKTANEDTQEKMIGDLVKRAHQVTMELDNQPEAKVWEAIILSTEAGIAGGNTALEDIRAAKDLLEQVIAVKPDTLHGSAYTSLGSLYYKAPAWPISFGDNAKAEANLKKALTLNPDGIDPNFFYGEFLHEQGKDTEAKQVLEHALNAAPRPGREVADAGRRDEISELLAKIASAS